MTIDIENAHRIAQLLPLIKNAETWQEAKKSCPCLPEMKTCYRWQDNGVTKFLAFATEPVEITSKSDIWGRRYTVTFTLTSGSQEMSYSY